MMFGHEAALRRLAEGYGYGAPTKADPLGGIRFADDIRLLADMVRKLAAERRGRVFESTVELKAPSITDDPVDLAVLDLAKDRGLIEPKIVHSFPLARGSRLYCVEGAGDRRDWVVAS